MSTVLPFLTGAAVGLADAAVGTSLADFAGLEATLTGRLVLPDDDTYARMATPWNVAAVYAPVAVVEAADADDVSLALRYAAAHGLQVDVRCTGHGAVRVEEDTLLVRTHRLDEVSIDPASGVARVGAGARWADVLAAAAPLELAGAVGSALGVGVVGYVTGGGVGPTARTFGLASDQVIAFDVVTADGVLRRATATENPALFWGLRGGKGALGIVTSVEMQLTACADIFAGCMYFDGRDTSAVLHSWLRWTRTLPDSATTSVAVLRLPAMPGVPVELAGRLTVAVRFVWVGDPRDGAAALQPIRAAGRPVLGDVGVMPFGGIGGVHADPIDPMPSRDSNVLLSDLDEEALDRIVAAVGPGSDCPQVIVELRHLGGALRPTHGIAPSAYAHRDAGYALSTVGLGVAPAVDAVATHAAALARLVESWSTGGCLPNWEASSDPQVVARKYPADVLGRLASLVAAYDPDRVLVAGCAVTAAAPPPPA